MPSKSDGKFKYIAGSDYFQEQELKKILGSIEDCETEGFSAEDFNPEFFFNFINSASLFQENKAAIVKSAHKIKNAADVITKCKDCVETHLIFLTPELKISKEINKALKEAGFETEIEKKARKYDLTGKILQMFADADFRIDSSSAAEINEIFEGDLKQITNEIEKLTLYFAYKKPKSAADVIKAVTARKHDSIFTFIDAYTARSRNVCNVMLDGFISSGENLNILISLLFKRMRELYLYINLKEQVKENRPWMLDKLKAGVRAWRHEDLIRLYGLFAELDYKNKTGQISTQNYMLRLVAAL
ncbi:DNA polymerase III delta [Denitrovibrio acetiphilus DSM 12809]|uniref:DNA-directed DNA polymerase n=1 Tax=Denitrovibrio acetiphilus (strain DSM 12809 / NBRC 114555 / N2460) TaxID=522772 RepID=D4H7K7_DENA2|nr:DNA polymerase III delta [Denitrovibrio acetiphilus]ADD68006.1 DNA polymerase III delta [Denitrovibrio acetiphilus DSM 12809]